MAVLISTVAISSCTSRWVRVGDSRSPNKPDAQRSPACRRFCQPRPEFARFPGCRETHLIHSLSRSLGRYTARAAGAVCCMRPGLDSHLPEAPLQLPSFTLSGILPATQEGPPNVYPRDSQKCPQLITALLNPISPEETLIHIYQWKEVRYSGKGPREAIN